MAIQSYMQTKNRIKTAEVRYFEKSQRRFIKASLKDLSNKRTKTSQKKKISSNRFLHIVPKRPSAKILELFQPGSFVLLKNQPIDLPPFQLISCKGGTCLVRQQAWGKYIHWEVEHHRLKSI